MSSLDTHASLHTCPWRDTRPVTSSRGRRLEETELRDLPAPPADSGSGVCACPMESDLEKGRVRLRFTNQACAEQWRESERREKGRVVGRKSGIVREGRGRVIEKASFYPMEQEHCQKSQASGGRVEHKQRENFGAAWRAIGSAGVGMDSRYSGPKSHSYVCLICSEGKHGERNERTTLNGWEDTGPIGNRTVGRTTRPVGHIRHPQTLYRRWCRVRDFHEGIEILRPCLILTANCSPY